MAYQSEIEKLEQRYEENRKQWFAALADSYRKAGDVDLALDVVRGGLEERPDYASAHIVLGRCLLAKDDDPGAGAAFERVLGLDPENIIALKSLSEISERGGDTDGMRSWLSRLLDVDPMNQEAQEKLQVLDAPAATAEPAEEPVVAEPEPVAEQEAVAEPEPVAEAEHADEPEPVVEADAEPASEGMLEPGAAWASEAMAELAAADTAPVPAVDIAAVEAIADGSVADDSVEDQGPAVEPGEPLTVEELAIEPTSLGGVHDGQTVEVEGLDVGFGQPDEDEAPQEAVDQIEQPAESTDTEEETPAHPDVDEAEMIVFDDTTGFGGGEPEGASEEDLELAGRESRDDLAGPMEFIDMVEAAEPEPTAEEPSLAAESTDEAEVETETDEEEALHLITPEEAEAEAGAGVEPGPLVTETMAEVYAQQGLYDQAREIYSQLLGSRPGDQVIIDRLAELTEQARSRDVESEAEQSRAARFSIAHTGGQSAVDFLRAVFIGGGAEEVEPVADAPPTQEASPLESAFGLDAEVPGSPTVPATDEVSLSSVFGAPSVPPKPEAPSADSDSEDGNVSYDQFFGGEDGSEPGDPDGPASDSGEGDDPDGDFRDWLEGLKT